MKQVKIFKYRKKLTAIISKLLLNNKDLNLVTLLIRTGTKGQIRIKDSN